MNKILSKKLFLKVYFTYSLELTILAQETFKRISIAYSILSDPNKRRQYDVSGPSMSMSDFEGLDISELGNVGTLYFLIIN